MTHLSLFAGIGGFDLGFELAGIETVANCEIDKSCQRVLKTCWPEVPIHDDIQELDGRDYAGVDIISGGFPCQDLSVAGKRAGITGARSGLFFELVRVVDEAKPRYLVWENVPGLLSSNGGDDFRAVLAALAEVGYFGAWRVLDSQFFGVAQRRRRIFGVFAQGDTGWRRAGAILLEPEGGGWNPEAGRKAGEEVADDAPDGIAATLNSGGNAGGFRTEPGEHIIAERTASFSSMSGRSGGWLPNAEEAADGCLVTEQSPTLRATGRRSAFPEDHALIAGVVSPQTNPDGVREAARLPRGMDSARYRGLGNAVTANVAYWIGQRIVQVDAS